MWKACVGFVGKSIAAGVPPIPKHHLVLHMFSPVMVARTGNPNFFSFFCDESLLQDVAKLCKRAYSHVFEQRVLTDFKSVHGRILARRKRYRLQPG